MYLLDDLLKQRENFSVIMGHSHYELANVLKKYDVIDNIWSLAMIVRPDISMSCDFIGNHIDELNTTYDMLSGDKSKQNMQDYLNVQLTRSGDYIVNNFDKNCTYFDNDVIVLDDNEMYLDVGAYDGTSIDQFILKTDNRYSKVLALEVMKNMCKSLKNKYNDSRIQIVNTGVSDHIGYDYFDFNDQSTCLSGSTHGERIEVNTIDSICDKYGVNPTIMKMCIGNTIIPILSGGEQIISELPKMIITAGIDPYALIEYIPAIEELSGSDKYDYYLRYTSAMAECLVLIAKPKDNIKKLYR